MARGRPNSPTALARNVHFVTKRFLIIHDYRHGAHNRDKFHIFTNSTETFSKPWFISNLCQSSFFDLCGPPTRDKSMFGGHLRCGLWATALFWGTRNLLTHPHLGARKWKSLIYYSRRPLQSLEHTIHHLRSLTFIVPHFFLSLTKWKFFSLAVFIYLCIFYLFQTSIFIQLFSNPYNRSHNFIFFSCFYYLFFTDFHCLSFQIFYISY